MNDITRRSVLKNGLALALAKAVEQRALADGSPESHLDPKVLPLNCTSGVYIPPRGRAFLKFSYNFPEPSVAFGRYTVSMRVYTYENTYAPDPAVMHVTPDEDGVVFEAPGLVWAGGQKRGPGQVHCQIRKHPDGITLQAKATIPGQTIKSIAVIIRGVPRGQVSRAGSSFVDPHEDEILESWPELNAGLNSPLLVIQDEHQGFTALSLAAESQTARPARFYLQPGPDGYRVELIYEREAWTRADTLQTPPWHIRTGDTYAAVAVPHYQHVEQAFSVPVWEQRNDVPAWMRQVSLVMALHGADWTGYIFNDYARQLSILRWTAERIDPAKVLVFLPAWDGRYYYNYPAYEPDPDMGGAEGFARLIEGAQKLGYHLVPMFGSNVANKDIAAFQGLHDGITKLPGDVPWTLDYVDWDNDRRGEANYPFMNLGTRVWREHLQSRIASCIERFGVDGYFLDIVGCSQNNLQGDMYLGTRQMILELAQRFPAKLVLGEMFFDSLVSVIPVFQAGDPAAYPQAFYRYGRLFEHLSWPAPGRGSTGVHEFGFSGRGSLPKKDQRVIPTLTVVDDTWTKYRAEMEQVIAVARDWRFPGSNS